MLLCKMTKQLKSVQILYPKVIIIKHSSSIGGSSVLFGLKNKQTCKHITQSTATRESTMFMIPVFLHNIKEKEQVLTHPDCDSVVRHCFQVRQRGGTLRHSVQFIYGCPQPSSVHVRQNTGVSAPHYNFRTCIVDL